MSLLGQDAVDKAIATVNQVGAGGSLSAAEMPDRNSLPYRVFQRRHAEYDPLHWRKVRALYHGGRKLFRDDLVMREMFPPHRNEYPGIYEERKARASYTPYAGEIIDAIVAALFTQPIDMTTEAEAGDTKNATPEYYSEFFADTSRPGTRRKVGLNRFLRRQILRALMFNRAWSRIDMPDLRDEEGEPIVFDSLAEQEEARALDCYLIELEPESVLNWKFDEDQDLEWIVIGHKIDLSAGPADESGQCTERYTFLFRDSWERWEVTYSEKNPPDEKTPVYLVDSGVHSFCSVPVKCLHLDEGLQAFEKLESLARSHFQLANALDWAVIQHLFAELYEFLAPEFQPGMPTAEAQQDPGRATSQARGQGWVQERGHQDRAEFVGPPAGGFKFALELKTHKKDEMHRVSHQMGLATDVGSAALRRSGESKKEDNKPSIAVLQALGEQLREHAEEIYECISEARGEEFADEWQAQGMQRFDIKEIGEILEGAVQVDSISIPSPTFQKRHKFMVAKAVLGEAATDEDLDAIEVELEKNITDEQYAPGISGDEVKSILGQLRPETVTLDDIPDDEDGDDDAPPALAGQQRGYASNPKPSN